jgi:predicted transcriptional regulator
MDDGKSSDKVKVTVNLTDDDVATLKALAGRKGTTVTSILRQAIALQKFVDDADTQGQKVLLEDRDKTLRQLVFR